MRFISRTFLPGTVYLFRMKIVNILRCGNQACRDRIRVNEGDGKFIGSILHD
jgi:hypothetical protein